MLITSSVLGQLIASHHEHALSSGRDSRMVIPGLTNRIAREIHEYLLAEDITSYLVIGDGLAPDKDKFWIRPVGLTSKRIGSFVAVACPGQLVHIQDSIRGSGGAIRSVAFSEEWPWIDNGSESFRFDRAVLKELVARWTVDDEQQQWLSRFVLTCLVPSTRSCSQRASLLLEDLLGNFSPSLYPNLEDVRLKMLFHSGIPRPEGGIPPVDEFVRKASRLCERVVNRCRKEDGARIQALDMVPRVVPSEREAIARKSLDTLLDGIGQSQTLDLGALAFFNCWGGSSEYWQCLDSARLERIFEVEPRERPELTCTVECDRSHVSGRGDVLATFHGEEVLFSGSYRLPQEELDKRSWTLQLTYRQRVLESETLHSAEGTFCFLLDTASAFDRYKSGLPLKLALYADEEIRTETRAKLHLCGPSRPAFVVVEPGFEVVDASTHNEDEVPDKKIETNEPSQVYMLAHDRQEPMFLDLDENELPIIETDKEGIWRCGSRVDPLEDTSGQVTRICRFGPLACTICFEARDVERGEFTLEDELRLQVSGEREGNIRELVAIFGGQSREPYRRLGKLNEAARRRTLLASDSASERGWRPLLVDLLRSDFHGAGLIGDYIGFRGTIDAAAFRSLSLPTPALELMREYASTRFSLMETIRENVEKASYTPEHPDYASHPIYVHARVPEMDELITRYLNSYQKILDYVDQSRSLLEWSQLFVMTYMDCVVHWDGSPLRNSLFLVGPWHPLILSKRYMVQASLFSRAMGLAERNGKAFRQLTVLLRDVTGFRWLAGLHRNDRLLEPLYVTPTSDPGWHLAIKQDLSTIAGQSRAGSLVGILGHLRDTLGLESPLIQGCTEDLARSGLASFMRAFPGRRSLGIRVRAGYSMSEIISSTDGFLHGEEGPTELGSQLPGGIHLYSEDPLGDLEGINWSNPPILTYHFQRDHECFREATPDIYLLAPTGEVSFRPADEKYGLPRGLGAQSVFTEPLCWLTEGQSQLPTSISLEFDEQPQELVGLGAAFVGAAAKVCQILQNRVVMVQSVDLPQQLDCPWAIVPGTGLDPAVFVKYVRDGSGRSLQERALWDYRLDIMGKKNSYYVLSTIPKGFGVAVNGFFGRDDVAGKFIEDLGALGIAIGGEALRSGRHALGVVGLVGTIRLLKGIGGSGKGIFQEGEDRIGFLIPVDSFVSFFGGNARLTSEAADDLKRTDLLAIQLVLPRDDNANLGIFACGVESKFVSRVLSQARALEALRQAQSSLEQFRALVETSRENWALPERMGLLALVRFGLRIASASRQERVSKWVEAERAVLRAILQGRYENKQALHNALVVSTEGQLHGVAEIATLPDGKWVRINRGHWPGIADTVQLEEIRDELSRLFAPPDDFRGVSGGDHGTPPADHPNARMSPEQRKPIQPPCDEVLAAVVESEEPQTPGSTHDVATLIDHETVTAQRPVVETGPLRKILLGVDDARRPVYYDPQSPVDPLDNLNLLVSGSSGTGKTQLLKYLICRLREQGKNVLVLDFKNDFASDPVFCSKASLERMFVSFDGLPFNPLIPYPIRHPGTGNSVVQTGQHISGVVSVLKRTYGLGAQQQIAVKNAIVNSFTDMGIPTTGTSPFDQSMQFPDFNAVGMTLETTNPRAYNRLDPLFTLDLFRSEYRHNSFHALVGRSMILNLSQIPSDEIKNTLAELIVLSAHAYYNTQPHSGIIRQVLVFDEAHRLLGSDYMTSLVRECRAYGVSTVLSSQYPTDFPGEISSSMATKVIHGNGREAEKVKAIVQMIGCSGREAEVSNLDRFQSFVDNRHYPHTLVRTMNYPLYLVWSFLLLHGETTRDRLAGLEGIDTDKLPVSNLVKQLERLGLAEEREGHIRLLQHCE